MVIRSVVPGRWRDITAVLAESDSLMAAEQRANASAR
jgi:hypothetical protein